MNTGERSDDDGQATEESGFESGVLTRRTFTVVVVTNDNPFDTLFTIGGCDLGNTIKFTSELVLDFVRGVVFCVDSTDQTVLCTEI